ncbi:chemotaxis protein MotB [Paenibacillus cellulosilyticus]|uniref:Chemotaxis protein MotB n=1 Tax=Paenibacillus cellulosilyticus TaxID=375489 RepID=A0A2V2YNT3_9BACL|nr:flagellar motor protein MotB [Paenibacillus cellulosilyticus]PWV97387.1 chemotaxis protein MotB [Paenibacillus cellulosilyticus]QKS48571.1 flagellar motor protein MotB [Paenibacillus cellulosilyticus]
MKKRKHSDHEEHADESWLLPYSDLMTLLLALFIVLFSMSSIDAKRFDEMSRAFNTALDGGIGVLDGFKTLDTTTTPTKDDKESQQEQTPAITKASTKSQSDEDLEKLRKKEQEDLEKLKKQLDQYIKTAGLTTQLDTKLNQSQLLITISDNALFASGSAVIKPDSKKLGQAISKMLKQYPGYEIIVAGHTDNQPISNSEFRNNWELSSQRALNFMEILLTSSSLDPTLISSTGYGEYRPLDTNKTEAGRAKNRRVEVSLMRKYQDLDSVANNTVATAAATTN